MGNNVFELFEQLMSDTEYLRSRVYDLKRNYVYLSEEEINVICRLETIPCNAGDHYSITIDEKQNPGIRKELNRTKNNRVIGLSKDLDSIIDLCKQIKMGLEDL